MPDNSTANEPARLTSRKGKPSLPCRQARNPNLPRRYTAPIEQTGRPIRIPNPRNPNPSFVQLLPPTTNHLFTSTAGTRAHEPIFYRPRPCTSTTAFTIRCRNKSSTPVGPLLDRDRDPSKCLLPSRPINLLRLCTGTGSCLERPRPFFPNRTVLRVRRLRLLSETFAQSQLFFESLYFMS
ncbi:hypothetical protein CTAM01_03542 [Colletotrichum tamarilloi]|uniref:Uncharacterized protein n=1 Tax=Colletotrichum tamarilloi TaxID=1209934 RepID=A0ABQ9RK02_9PEZI|nr:uncharacterized protein CTAM01_03542 [Colletotrichum tamarilloi]KAK1506207.1 hypothetical protein CTAM01_03542 [Colletotrichum tamarilloi]